jgi:phosphoribosylformylglycinamidine (FGAM) synthase-like amidotransferase family enzyme
MGSIAITKPIFLLHLAGADSRRMHINELISKARSGSADPLGDYQILVFGGGFSWADDHGAGVLMASKMKRHLGRATENLCGGRKSDPGNM